MGSWVRDILMKWLLLVRPANHKWELQMKGPVWKGCRHCNYFTYLSKIIRVNLNPEGSVHRHLTLTHTYTMKFSLVLTARMRSMQHFCTMDAIIALNSSFRHMGFSFIQGFHFYMCRWLLVVHWQNLKESQRDGHILNMSYSVVWSIMPWLGDLVKHMGASWPKLLSAILPVKVTLKQFLKLYVCLH